LQEIGMGAVYDRLSVAVGGAIAGALLWATPAGAATVKETFEKYALIGVLASDCSKPPGATTPYLVNRAIDADHVQSDRMVGASARDLTAIVDHIAETTPNQVTVSGTIDGQQLTTVLQVDRGQMRAMESTGANGDKVISAGRYSKGGAATPSFGRCLQKVTLRNAPAGGGKCIEPLNGEIKAGVHLQMWNCDDTPPQIFAFDTLNQSLMLGDFCLDTEGGRGQPGTQLALALCNGGPSQVWGTQPNGDTVKIVGIAGLCIDISYYSKDNRAAMGLWNCHGQSNQSWELRPAMNLTVEPATNRDGHHVSELNLAAADATLCQMTCIENQQCTAWVYRKPEAWTFHLPHCWLLDKTTKVNQGDATSVSGTVRPEAK
jgi:hypothetical protein